MGMSNLEEEKIDMVQAVLVIYDLLTILWTRLCTAVLIERLPKLTLLIDGTPGSQDMPGRLVFTHNFRWSKFIKRTKDGLLSNGCVLIT